MSPNFAYAKIAGFLLLETSLAVLVIRRAVVGIRGLAAKITTAEPSESLGEDPES